MSCHCHSCNCTHEHHEHGHDGRSLWARFGEYFLMGTSALLLAAGLTLDFLDAFSAAPAALRPALYLAALLPVAVPVMGEAWEEMRRGDVFNEFTLMLLAAVGAVGIGEYPEAVAVMLFYAVGEHFQDRAADKARDDVRALVDLQPREVLAYPAGAADDEAAARLMPPTEIEPGCVVALSVGDRVPLDGTLLGTAAASFDTSALTGESVPRTIEAGDAVSAGMLVADRAVRLRVTKRYEDSALARILRMVEEAAERKAPAELFIRRFARIYTPVVIALAALVAVVPPLLTAWLGIGAFAWTDFIYRALVFLVVSCPCALVVSVPLSYFSGIGYASRRGILFKGGNYLDALARADAVVFDKTGTLTRGEFAVTEVVPSAGFDVSKILAAAAAAESRSSHPLARAVVAEAEARGIAHRHATDVEERAGRGLRAVVDGCTVLAGNRRLLEEEGIVLPDENAEKLCEIVLAVDGRYAGRIVLSDAPRPEAAEAVGRLTALGIGRKVILSGDRTPVVEHLATDIGIGECHGDLLPEQKVEHLQKILDEGNSRCLVFVGDGINDAPSLALAHVGIAMGGAGSDAAVETADVVIESDNPAKVAEAIAVGRATRRLVRFNIALAIGFKAVVMLLGLFGLAPLWLAVLGDTGVALVCVLNVFALPRLVRK